jgi:hypothetical protein
VEDRLDFIGEFFSKLSNDLTAVVFRAVINNDDLDTWIGFWQG